MKKPIIKFRVAAATTLALATLIFATSCSKDTDNPSNTDADRSIYQGKSIEDKQTQQRLLELSGMLPTVVVYNSTMNKYISLDLNNPKSFNFASPGGGLSFSSPEGSVQFVSSSGGGLTILTTPSSSGGGGGGGIVTAGGVSLNVNYVVCFASEDEDVAGIDLFDFGGPTSGFSGAFGIAGDFEALATGEIDEDADITDFFFGIVMFVAFADTPDGDFPVVDFFEFGENQYEDFDNKGLAYFVSFAENNVGIFFSKSGSVSFSGGSVQFNGTYFGITGDLFDFENEEEPDFIEVSGTGVLECGA